MSLNLAMLLRENAQHIPDRTALLFQGEGISYQTLDQKARAFAGLLRELGVEAGQHVVLFLADTPEFSICYFGALYAGNPVVPLHPQLTTEEVAWHLEDSDGVLMVTRGVGLATAKQAMVQVPTCCKLLVSEADELPLDLPEAQHLQLRMEMK